MGKTRWLTPEIVVATAVRLVDDSRNLESLKLKDVAAALDVRVPSLYNHVEGLSGLQRQMRLTLLRELEAQLRQIAYDQSRQSGAKALRATAHAYRSFAHAHPGSYPLLITAPEPDDAAHVALSQSILQLFLLLLSSLGYQEEAALHALRGFRSLIHGFVSLELAGGFKMALDLDNSFDHLLDIYLRGLEEGM